MKLLVPAILLVLCSAALSQGTSSTTEPTTTAETTTQTTPSTVTPTSTSEVPTTELPSTTTSEVTTKAPPVTTTPEAPTTTEITTTEVPKTTTLSPVSTTKVPEMQRCKFNVTHENETCIRAEMKAEFIVPLSKDKNHPILLDCESELDQSDCSSNETQKLVIVKEGLYVLTMIFEKEKDTVYVRNISFVYSLPEVKDVVANNSGNLIKMKAGNSYLCKSEIDIPLENVTMKIMEIQVQAFAEKGDNFGKAEECPADDKVSDIVPIAVGVALGALIIIVLIAYLVGRRRSRQKGYQSV